MGQHLAHMQSKLKGVIMAIRASVAATVGAAVGLVIAGTAYVAVTSPVSLTAASAPAQPVKVALAAAACRAPALFEDGACVTRVVRMVDPVPVIQTPPAGRRPAPGPTGESADGRQADAEVEGHVAGSAEDHPQGEGEHESGVEVDDRAGDEAHD